MVPVFPDAGSEVRRQHLTPAGFERLGNSPLSSTGASFATDNPDLTAFRDRGGKAIVWHGWADQLITAEGTVDYYNARAAADGRREEDSGIHPPVHGARACSTAAAAPARARRVSWRRCWPGSRKARRRRR